MGKVIFGNISLAYLPSNKDRTIINTMSSVYEEIYKD
jgi:hypothetical protein